MPNLLRLATIAASAAVIGGSALAQDSPPRGAPAGTPGGEVPPRGATEGVTGNTPSIGDQVDQMRRHINGEREPAPAARRDRARAATAAEVVAGAAVNDSAGLQLGTIESVEAEGAVIATAVGRALVPLDAFGHNSRGLLLQTTKAQFESQVARANATPS